MLRFARGLLVGLLVACFAPAQPRNDSLAEFLQKYLGNPDAETKTTKFAVAFVDLRG